MAPSAPSAPLRPQYPVGASLAAVATAARAPLPPAFDAAAAAVLLITGVTHRAQDAQPGDLFAALPGSRAHGAGFVADAARAGALAVLTDPAGAALIAGNASGDRKATRSLPVLVVDRPRDVLGAVAAAVYGEPSTRLAVVGITGTAGKTTTGYLLEAALGADGSRTGLIGTVETRIDGRVAPSALTTPEAPDLQALFAVMVESGITTVAMEVSSHALALGRVAGTHYAVAAFTNLSQDHLDFHHDMEDYFRAKELLFDGRAARHVIMVDDSWGERLAARHPGALTVSAAGRAADWTVSRAQPAGAGVQQVTVSGPHGPLTFELGLPGAFNISNAVVALACVDALGRDVRAAAASLAWVRVPGRMERVTAGQDFLAMVDYAHKPGALAAVLDALREGLTGRLIVAIGAGGERDAGKRPMMGAEAVRRADLVIVTDDNPRSEDPALIRQEVLAGARAAATDRPGTEVLEIGDRRAAIRAAVRAARKGDAVVIAGKGHELGQYVAGVVHPFSDRDELAMAVAELAAAPDAPASEVPASEASEETGR